MPLLACDAFAEKSDVYAVVCEGLTSPTDDALVQAALDDASDILVRLSGFRFWGACTTVTRPCRPCVYGTWCGCCTLDRLPIPPDAYDVVVKIDGVTLDEASYGIVYDLEGSWLVRLRATDAEDVERWPYCQKLDLPSTEEDTFEVTYTVGVVGLVEKQAAIGVAIRIIQAQPDRGLLAIAGARSLSGGGVTFGSDFNEDEQDRAASALPTTAPFIAKWNPQETIIANMGWSPEVDV